MSHARHRQEDLDAVSHPPDQEDNLEIRPASPVHSGIGPAEEGSIPTQRAQEEDYLIYLGIDEALAKELQVNEDRKAAQEPKSQFSKSSETVNNPLFPPIKISKRSIESSWGQLKKKCNRSWKGLKENLKNNERSKGRTSSQRGSSSRQAPLFAAPPDEDHQQSRQSCRQTVQQSRHSSQETAVATEPSASGSQTLHLKNKNSLIANLVDKIPRKQHLRDESKPTLSTQC
jgi:hypothetical protein